VITISVESDEEQWAIGTALVNGALGFGNWPYAIRRARSADRGGGWSSGASAGSSGTSTGSGGGAAGAVASSAGGTGAAVTPGCAGGGSGGVRAVVPDYRWSLGIPLRGCCATMPESGHREGCDEDGRT
jgi:hypothetical protein